MTRILFVTRLVPSAVGGGGSHRGYQTVYDLAQAVGPEQVTTVSLPQWQQQQPGRSGSNSGKLPVPARLKKKLVSYRRKLRLYLENPFRPAGDWSYHHLLPQKFLADYERTLQTVGRPVVCVVDNAGLAKVISLNQLYHIPTILCNQNLESLVANSVNKKDRWLGLAAGLDLAREFKVLAQLDERLLISRVETGLVGGFGLSSHYYPYQPVGAIRQRLALIRQKRMETRQKPGLFLLLGSAFYPPIENSMRWLLNQVRTYGLPEGVQVVGVGKGTDTLLAPGETVSGVDLRGWVEQETLDRLLIEAQAVLVPALYGFGALTRLPELTCAGLAVITSGHATWAMEPPPGLLVADNSWPSWLDKISYLKENGVNASVVDYDHWQKNQPRPVENVVKQFL